MSSGVVLAGCWPARSPRWSCSQSRRALGNEVEDRTLDRRLPIAWRIAVPKLLGVITIAAVRRRERILRAGSATSATSGVGGRLSRRSWAAGVGLRVAGSCRRGVRLGLLYVGRFFSGSCRALGCSASGTTPSRSCTGWTCGGSRRRRTRASASRSPWRCSSSADFSCRRSASCGEWTCPNARQPRTSPPASNAPSAPGMSGSGGHDREPGRRAP